MSSKKKLVISLSVAAAVLVAAIIAIVAVFAAASQTVASTVKISYTASEVDGSIAAEYSVAGGAVQDMGSASFSAGSSAITGELKGAEIALTPDGDYVVFTYTFKNNGQKNMQISNTITTLDSNLKATYKILNVDDEYQDSLSSAILAGKANAADTAKEAKIEVRIDVANKAFDIEEVSMSFSWTMSSTTAQATIGVAQAG